jgi:hypothetical protein
MIRKICASHQYFFTGEWADDGRLQMSSFLRISLVKKGISYRLIRVVLVAQAEVSCLKQVEVFVDIVQKILTRSLSLEKKKIGLKYRFYNIHKFD